MNVAAPLLTLAGKHPHKCAIRAPKKKWLQKSFHYEDQSYQELEERSRFYGHYLLDQGLKPGDKVLFFVKPCLDFTALTFSLFRAGLIPIFIDPGMGRKLLLRSIEQIEPQALIAESVVFVLKFLSPASFRSLNYSFNVNTLKKACKNRREDLSSKPLMEDNDDSDTAAILFTSGGTGIPKGVRYTHGIFNHQREMLREMFSLTSDDIDLPGFPLFAFFTVTMGMTSVIPALNPAKPAQVKPELVVRNILDNKTTFLAGSPAIWERVGRYCEQHQITLPSVKYLVMFGAPVSMDIHRLYEKILPHGDTYTPYGATESLPVSCIAGSQLQGELYTRMMDGAGTCVGLPCPQVVIKIAPISDGPIAHEQDVRWLAPGELGEICVLSDVVTPEYVGMEQKTKEAKITSLDGRIWHRMGDLGTLDEQGRLWFCGRKSHRLVLKSQVVPTIPLENMINECKPVRRSALVGVGTEGDHTPHLIVQRQDGRILQGPAKVQADQEIKDIITKYPDIHIEHIHYQKSFPVDVRHNIKIDRLKLADQIARQQ